MLATSGICSTNSPTSPQYLSLPASPCYGLRAAKGLLNEPGFSAKRAPNKPFAGPFLVVCPLKAAAICGFA